MSKNIKISIPTPCHEDWTVMTPAEKGRFCGSCQKAVHDFTRSSDREIATALLKDANACGRFLNTQLDRRLSVPSEKNTTWLAASALVITLIGSAPDAAAQNKVATLQQPPDSDEIMGEVVFVESKVTLSGTVTDTSGLPIPGVNVIVKSSGAEAQTGMDGSYSVEAAQGDVIEYSLVGMKTATITVQEAKSVCVAMDEDCESITVGAVVTMNNRTFFGRIFHSVGNLFRKYE